ncbi:hypothetical protein, partial [Halorubrum sp. Hd13]|uniref:hypothetical protein n=1 Tax=Halorubrum sp. Hd13 TaxID=1480728 RepID=UPI0014826187
PYLNTATTAALLSLLVARQLLAELTTPEHLLKRTAKSVSRDTFVKSDSEPQSGPAAPSRTALFTIEQILISAHNNEDEYTVQQAIHQLWLAIDRLLTPPITAKIRHFTNEPSHTDSLDLDRILEYWSTAVAYGSKGPFDRIERTASAHRHILITLLRTDEIAKTVEQLEHLYDLSISGFNHSGTQSVLSEYSILAPDIAAHTSSEPLITVLRHYTEFIDEQLCRLDEVDERKELKYTDALLAEIICEHIVLLEQIWVQKLERSTTRSRTDSVLTQLSTNLISIFDKYDEGDNTISRKQTLLTELHKRLMKASSALDGDSTQPSDRYLNLIVETSLILGREPDEVADVLNNELAGYDDQRKIINDRLKNWSLEDTYQIELRTQSLEGEKISNFIDILSSEIVSE